MSSPSLLRSRVKNKSGKLALSMLPSCKAEMPPQAMGQPACCGMEQGGEASPARFERQWKAKERQRHAKEGQ